VRVLRLKHPAIACAAMWPAHIQHAPSLQMNGYSSPVESSLLTKVGSVSWDRMSREAISVAQIFPFVLVYSLSPAWLLNVKPSPCAITRPVPEALLCFFFFLLFVPAVTVMDRMEHGNTLRLIFFSLGELSTSLCTMQMHQHDTSISTVANCWNSYFVMIGPCCH
jgi:hypothetical protein